MPYKVIRYTDKKEMAEEGLPSGWHLLVEHGNCDGEYTACGNATPEYATEEKQVDKGGVTCTICKSVIAYYKTIK